MLLARHERLVIADSDVTVPADYLRKVVARRYDRDAPDGGLRCRDPSLRVGGFSDFAAGSTAAVQALAAQPGQAP
jgi:hypothetical protein